MLCVDQGAVVAVVPERRGVAAAVVPERRGVVAAVEAVEAVVAVVKATELVPPQDVRGSGAVA